MNTESLATELEQQGIAGRIITPVHDVYRKARMLVAGERDGAFGLSHLLPTNLAEIVRTLEQLSGWRLPEGDGHEVCWVDPGLVAAQVASAGERLRLACERRERVLFGTGHPAGPLELYIRVAAAMRERGADVVEFAQDEPFQIPGWRGRQSVRYVCSVACVYTGGGLAHCHDAEPMEYLLDTGPRPDLVVGDHGFVGVGLARGAEAVALVDANDPGLLLAWGRGLPVTPILCDDNRPPDSYAPVAKALISVLS